MGFLRIAFGAGFGAAADGAGAACDSSRAGPGGRLTTGVADRSREGRGLLEAGAAAPAGTGGGAVGSAEAVNWTVNGDNSKLSMRT